MPEGTATFGSALSAARLRASLTQQELADRAGISVRSLRNIEQGRVQPRALSARRLAEVVGLDEADLREPPDPLLEIGVLGPLVVRHGDEPLDVGPSKQRCLLALLALQANRVVDRAEITEVLWGAHPPPSHVNLVHTYVKRLRSALRHAPVITAARTGYLLTVDEHQLDLLRFDTLTAKAQRVRGEDPRAALDLFDQALSCWRAPILADADISPNLHQHPSAVAAAHRRLVAVLAHADIAIDGGRYEQAAEHLRALVHDEPLHEGLHARLMLSLAGLGEQSAALRLHADIRQRLADELGIQPGPVLQDAHLRVLRQNVPSAGGVTSVPAQLPAKIDGFVGRASYLDQLDAQPGGATIVTGTAGVGKTALAVHWAHRVRHRFPDGQLYVDLRGYGPEEPLRPDDALSGFLRALGVEGAGIPTDQAERAARFRTLVDGRRMLLLLDNASTVEQVRPLLPGTSTCHVVITSRDTLPGLVARDGARRVQLGLLSAGEALALLCSLIGDRVYTEPEAADALAARCVRLPLALRLAAELGARRPSVTLAELVDELTDEQYRLDTLDAGGDTRTALRAVFSWSYQQLGEQAARMFRLLASAPIHDFDAYVAAALTGSDLGTARQQVDVLFRAHLIEHTIEGRLHLHDLLRTYATELSAELDSDADRQESLTRLFGYYLHVTAEAMHAVAPYEPHRRPTVPAWGGPSPSFAHYDDGIAWLHAERVNLFTTAKFAADRARPSYTSRLSGLLFRYLDVSGHHDDALFLHDRALTAARAEGDHEGEVYALRGLACVHRWLGNYGESLTYNVQLLNLAERTGNRVMQTSSLNNLALVHWKKGEYEEAVRYYESALTITDYDGERATKGRLRNNLGAVYQLLGRHDEALAHHQYALDIAQEDDDHDLRGWVLVDLGVVNQRLHRYDEASELQRSALELARERGDRNLEGEALNGLGEIARSIGDPHQAIERHEEALRVVVKIGDRREEARAHEGIGHAHEDLAQPDLADRHRREAFALYRDLGLPDADRIAAGLAAPEAD